HTIAPHRALFTAMSTTLGISTIVGPAIAIRLGGPGALVGFLLTSFFGGAAVFTEVQLAVKHRRTLLDGKIMGGPMEYLSKLISPAMAKWYALGCLALMTVWSGAQANQLAAVLDSPFLGDFRISTTTSGILLTLFTLVVLMGGIKTIGAISARLVPTMFLLYITSCLWILAMNSDQLANAFLEIFKSFLYPREFVTGSLIGGIVSSLRWGIFKGVQCCEAGIGTQTIPHSMAQTTNAEEQATLAMLATYSAGLVAFLSGLVALVTGYWKDPTISLGVNIMIASFEHYLSFAGVAIVMTCTFLFGIGTILGNAYNGGQCFNFLTDFKYQRHYLLGLAVMIFVSAVAEPKLVWTLIDIVLALMSLPHILSLVKAVRANQLAKA
ncbi:MAG: sodium:alanine symporter family protein, partial [Chlamydiae bacterium]|nr:sodium:alanine symporter family protein [Chlamydiota bacterium]